ncbi:hypothetical protein LAZ67_11000570 [Cordylochernes scorpioides]|uniref:Mos1 transposase HTH domain-containing protein n=1 Tax=Cordylochernes scorpioides TaxID=51811 RepID=A0ABY6L1R8_9ARAC|nr:hypothetical protein LAZ67_11000570 [Cordylochernes scorpioides]
MYPTLERKAVSLGPDSKNTNLLGSMQRKDLPWLSMVSDWDISQIGKILPLFTGAFITHTRGSSWRPIASLKDPASEYPVGKNQHFQHLLFFAFHRGQKAAEAARDICNVYVKGVIGEREAQIWFAKFKNGDLDLEDTPQSRRPSEFDEEHLKALLKEDGRQTTRELAEKK